MVTPTFKVDISDFQANFFTKSMQMVQKAQKRNLSLLGGWIRLVARRSIKDAAKHTKKMQALFLKGSSGEVYSRPGQPPLSKLGFLKEFLYYAYDPVKESVVIGPASIGRRTGSPEALEGGGKVIITTGFGVNRRQVAVVIQARPFMAPALEAARIQKKFEFFWKDSIKAA